jgi:hypothetical protein
MIQLILWSEALHDSMLTNLWNILWFNAYYGLKHTMIQELPDNSYYDSSHTMIQVILWFSTYCLQTILWFNHTMVQGILWFIRCSSSRPSRNFNQIWKIPIFKKVTGICSSDFCGLNTKLFIFFLCLVSRVCLVSRKKKFELFSRLIWMNLWF